MTRISLHGSISRRAVCCLSVFILTITTTTTSSIAQAFRLQEEFRPQLVRQTTRGAHAHARVGGAWGLALVIRGGDDNQKPSSSDRSVSGGSSKKTAKKDSIVEDDEDDDEIVDEEEEEWEDAQEEVQEVEEGDDEIDNEEDDTTTEEVVEEDWTDDVGAMGEREAEEEEEEVSLSEVLLAEQQEEEETIVGDTKNAKEEEEDDDDDDDDFVDALQDGIDIDMISSSAINTDDESSSANVDRMDLADAYDDEGMLEEEEEEQLGTPVLATGEDDDDNDDDDDDDNHQVVTNDYGANIAPGGGAEDENSSVSSSVAGSSSSSSSAVEEATTTNDEQIPQVITDEMRKALKDLHWKKKEIRYMRPDMAAVVVGKKLRRPREGMPASFYTTGNKPATSSSNWGGTIKRVVVPVVLGAAATYAGSGVDWDDLLDSVKPSPIPTPVVESAPPVVPATPEATAGDGQDEAASEAEEEEVPEVEEEPLISAPEKGPHSIKPYSKPVDELDETWLDKIITKIENVIKGIWTKEL